MIYPVGARNYLLALIISSVFSILVSCTGNSIVEEKLSLSESLMEEKPDSALFVLKGMADIQGEDREIKAKYSLLFAQALDKNYIDTTDFKVLQPAIDYYINDDKGSTNDKMRTLYYQARIFQNGGDNDNAMKTLVSCLDLKDKATDSLTIARALVAQACILNSVYEFEKYVSNELEAATLYEKKGYNAQRADCLLMALDGATLLNDKTTADSIFNICLKESESGNLTKERLIPRILIYFKRFRSSEELCELIIEAENLPSLTIEGYLNLANCYLHLNETQKAFDILSALKNELSNSSHDYDEIKFNGLLAAAFESKKDYKDALEQYQLFIDLLMKDHDRSFKQRIESSEQRHMLELKAQKELKAKDNLIWGCVAGIMALSFGIAVMSLVVRSGRIKKNLALQQEKTTKLENENLRHRIAVLESERDELNSLIASQPELPAEVREAVQVRIKMLNSLLASQISSNEKYGKDYEAWVSEQIADTESFMNSTRLAFKASHPDFISHFEKHGLTTDEINYVCLYAIGLKGIEVGAYMKKRSHVNVSSAIRRKLGLDKHETNIGIYVRRLLK